MRNLSSLDASFEHIGEILPDFVARYDNQGRIRYMNRSLLNALQVDLSDVVGKTPDVAWPDGRFSELQRKVMECMDSDQIHSIDITVPYAHGVEYHNIRLVCERCEAGKRSGVLALGRNLTDRFLLERNLAAASRLKALGQLASGVCHEVNNPLAIIAACSKKLLLQSRQAKDYGQDIMKTSQWIDQAVERIASIMKSLQILSLEETRPDCQTISVIDVIRGALSFFRETFKLHSIELVEDYGHDASLVIDGSRSQLTRAIFNLLSNSYEAVFRSPDPWIKVSLQTLDERFRIRVMDSGPRLEKDTILSLMQPFFTTKELGRGAGLGLSVASAIAESHRGKLFYDRESEHTCFVLELPRHRQDPTLKS